MKCNFVPTLRSSDPVTILSEPYFRAEMEATDQANIYYVTQDKFTKTSGLSTVTYQGFPGVGIGDSSTLSSAYVESDVNIAESGEYRVFVHTIRMGPHPSSPNPRMTLTVDSTDMGTVNTEHNRKMASLFDFGTIDLTAGVHTLHVDIPTKRVFVAGFILKRIVRMNTDKGDVDTSLEPLKVSYTKNSIAEMNTAKMSVVFKEDFYEPDNPYSGMVFDFTDPVTIWVGETRRTAKPEFGGYLQGYSYDMDSMELNLDFVDRMMDLYREPTYAHFNIGNASNSDQKSMFGLTKFNNIIDFVKYATQNIEYPLHPEINASYAFKLDMGDVTHYNGVSVSGYLKKHEKNIGNPAPSLMLHYENLNYYQCADTSEKDCDAILYTAGAIPPNAYEHPILCFDYITRGASSVNPLRFNVVISMYKEGETEVDAQEYTITFNSSRTEGKVIGSVTPQFTGVVNSFKFNLKTAFDKYAPSSEYHITQIRLVDTLTMATAEFLSGSVIYLDNIGMMAESVNMKIATDTPTNNQLEIIRKICEESGYDGYIRYGSERRNDVFVLEESGGNAGEIEAVQGVNILNVTSIEYKPTVSSGEDGFANKAYRHYHVKKGSTETHYSVLEMNVDSWLRYGSFQNYKDLTDVNNAVDATKDAKELLESNAYSQRAFSLDIRGTVLLNPSNYLITDLPQPMLSGNHIIKSMENSLDLESEEFLTSIDLNKPGKKFNKIILNIKRQLLGMSSLNSRTMYSRQALNSLGFSSPGAFIQRKV